jgi:hypothetical protein
MGAQQLGEQRAVTAPRVFAVTTDRKVRLLCECSKQRDQALRLGTRHFSQVPFRIRGPARIGPGLRLRIGDQLAAGRNLGHPHIEEIVRRVILFPHSTRQQPHGAEAKSLAAQARRPDSHNANRH